MINNRGAVVVIFAISAFLLISFNAQARPVRQPTICVQVKSYVDRFGQTLVEFYARKILKWSDKQVAAVKKKCGG